MIRWRYVILAVTLILVAMAASGARLLQFDSDYRVFFGKDNPQLQAFERIQNTYTKYDNLLFVLAPASGKVFTRDTLQAVQWLTEQGWQVPYASRVDSITNFQHTRAEGDDLVVGDLVDEVATLSDTELAQVESIALSEPLLRNRLISGRTHVTGVNVTVQLPGADLNLEVPEVAMFGRQLAQQLTQRFPEVEVHLTGIIMMNTSFPEASQNDLKALVPLMFLVVIVVLGFLIRSVTGTVGAVLVMVFSILTAMGLAGWFGIKLTGPSAAAPIVILTIAVADCVHFLANMVHVMRAGKTKQEAIVESLRVNLQPIFLTSLTTAIGFLSMNFSDAPPFHDLGNISAMGVAAAFVFSVIFLPAFVASLPMSVKPGVDRTGQGMRWLSEFVVRNQRRLLWGLAPIFLILIAFVPRNELNDEFVKYFDESIAFRRATDFATENLSGIYTIQFSLNAGESGGIARPDFLVKVEEFANWFRAQPEVVHVNTITDMFKRLNKNLHSDDASWYRLPDQRDLAAQYLLLYEMSLPYGLDLNDQINIDKSAIRFVVTMENLSSKDTLAIAQRARQWLMDNAPDHMLSEGSSPNIMFAHIGKRNIISMVRGTTIAMVLISIILIIALRSVKIGLLSMVPNLLPALLAFGLWGLLVGRIGLALSVVAAVSLGIIVDDTVHFLSKYLRARRENGLQAADAVRYAFSTVGTALWVTSLILVAGFLVLAQSAFEVNAGMGLLTAITIVFALIADFLFLPPLLMALDRGRMQAVCKTEPDQAAL